MPTKTTTAAVETSPAEGSRQRLAEAQTRAARAADELASAREGLETMLEELGSGNFGPSDLSTARSRVEIAEAVHARAEAVLDVARRAVVTDDLTLATLAADAIATMFGGAVPVTASAERPTSAPDSLPAVVIVQSQPHTLTQGGGLTGSLEVFYLRSQLHAPLDLENVGKALDDAGVYAKRRPSGAMGTVKSGRIVTTSGGSVDGGTTRANVPGCEGDRLTLTIRRAFAAVPVLPAEPDTMAVTVAVQELTRDEMGCRLKPAERPRSRFRTQDDMPDVASSVYGQAQRRPALVDVQMAQVVENVPAADGTRHRVVDVPVTFYGKGTGPGTITERLRLTLERVQVGKAMPGLGRVLTAEVRPVPGRRLEDDLRANASAVIVRLTATSRDV